MSAPSPAANDSSPTWAGVLTLTHSSRLTEPNLCSLEHFQERYNRPDRLTDLPDFESLAPSMNKYFGAVSFLRLESGPDGQISLQDLGVVHRDEKLQHVIFSRDGSLLAGFESAVERWQNPFLNPPFKPVKKAEVLQRFEHPHLAALHTIAELADGQIIASSSCADAVQIIDMTHLRMSAQWPLPADVYGKNYPLSEDMDLRAHYIPNDLQIAHINSAYPLNNGKQVVTSSLIPGAIGRMDLSNGKYQELTRGHQGCHGARVSDQGVIYFADSSRGDLVFLNEQGDELRRYGVASRWLHDVVQLKDEIYAFGLADHNELQIIDISSGTYLYRRSFPHRPWLERIFQGNTLGKFLTRSLGWRGNSTQFMSFQSDPIPGLRPVRNH